MNNVRHNTIRTYTNVICFGPQKNRLGKSGLARPNKQHKKKASAHGLKTYRAQPQNVTAQMETCFNKLNF